jgi:predicted cation transporter
MTAIATIGSEPDGWRSVAIVLGLILIAVLLGPIFVKPIERNLEVFFLVLGALAAFAGGQFGWPLVRDALTQPIGLALAVLVFGIIARLMRSAFDTAVQRLRAIAPPRWIYFSLIAGLGVLSCLITSVVAALLLVEAIAMLKLDRPSETAAVVLACFAIGLGSGLLPTGGPLAAIAVAALHADFAYLMRLLWPLVLAGILIAAGLSLFIAPIPAAPLYGASPQEAWQAIFLRALRVYGFVAGLVGLSGGVRPLVGPYVSRLPPAALYWLNSISAVVDNATLTAAEVGPALTHGQQRAILMGLLISGGMLIPGNIPNIVAANRLGIGSREWARIGLLVGLPLMLLCFVVLYFIG